MGREGFLFFGALYTGVCVCIEKPFYTLRCSVVARSLGSGARLPVSKRYHLVYFSVP